MNTKNYKPLVKCFLVIFFIACIPFLSYSQFDAFPDGGNPDAPIDGGLSLLVAAGIGYGAKKLKTKNRNL